MRKYASLRAKMQKLNMDQEYIGRQMNMNVMSVSNRFTGKTPWKLDEMYAVLDIIGEPDEKLSEYFPRNGINLTPAKKERDAKRDKQKQEILTRVTDLISIL